MTLIILCVFVLSGCGKKGAGGHGGPPPGFAVSVVGGLVKTEPIEEKIALVGTLAANESVEIKSEIAGIVEEINFEEGKPVKAGDVLFKIDESKLRSTLEEIKASLDLSETTAKRYETLLAGKAVSQQEYDESVANLASNRAKAQLIEAQLKDATIEAPFDGTLGQRMISPGQFVNMGTSLGFVVSVDPVKAEFSVPERYLAQIHDGQTVEIKVTAYPEETFKGDVYFVDPKVDEATRTVLMKARISNRDGRLKPGMFANLDLIIRTKNNALVIPETSVLVKGDETSVYIVTPENKASLRPITIGARLAGRVEVTKGLQAGDVVIVEGFQKLGEGSPVKVRFEQE